MDEEELESYLQMIDEVGLQHLKEDLTKNEVSEIVGIEALSEVLKCSKL